MPLRVDSKLLVLGMNLPDNETPERSKYSRVCELLCGGTFLWKAPRLPSGVRLCSKASLVGTRLLGTAGRLNDPLDRPKIAELANYKSFEGSELQSKISCTKRSSCQIRNVKQQKMKIRTHHSIFWCGHFLSNWRFLLCQAACIYSCRWNPASQGIIWPPTFPSLFSG